MLKETLRKSSGTGTEYVISSVTPAHVKRKSFFSLKLNLLSGVQIAEIAGACTLCMTDQPARLDCLFYINSFTVTLVVHKT